MANDYVTLSGYIKTLLESISQIKFVYEYEKPDLLGYPACTITSADSEVEEMDTGFNFRTFGFKVRIYQEIEKGGRGPGEGERIMRVLLDAVLTKFDQDIGLGGNCIRCKPVPGVWGWSDREKIHRVAEVTLKCLVKVDRTA